jgi:phage gpG-like protein
MGSVIRINVTGLDKAGRYILDISQYNRSEVLDFISEEALTVTEEAFQNESDPVNGELWLPSLRAEMDGGLTLTDTARLRRSITYENHTSGIMLIGTNVVYGKDHQNGQKMGKMGFVQRRFLGVPSDFMENISEDTNFQRILRIV